MFIFHILIVIGGQIFYTFVLPSVLQSDGVSSVSAPLRHSCRNYPRLTKASSQCSWEWNKTVYFILNWTSLEPAEQKNKFNCWNTCSLDCIKEKFFILCSLHSRFFVDRLQQTQPAVPHFSILFFPFVIDRTVLTAIQSLEIIPVSFYQQCLFFFPITLLQICLHDVAFARTLIN